MESESIKTIQCPDCLAQIQKLELKEHVLNCKKYKKTYLNNIMRSIDFLKPNNAEFLIAQCQIASQRLKNIIAREKGKSQSSHQNNIKSQHLISRPNQNISHQNGKKLDITIQNNDIPKQNMQSNNKQVSGFKRKDNIIETSSIWIQKSNQKPQVNHTFNTQKKEKTKSFLDQIQDDYKRIFYSAWRQQQREKVHCSNCPNIIDMNDFTSFQYADICLHPICIKCFQKFIIEENYIKNNGKFKCSYKECKEQIPTYQLQQIFGKAVIQNLEQMILRKNMNLITCVKCKSSFDYIKGKSTDAPNVDIDGKKLDQKYIQLYSQHRFVCPNCKTQQCKQCHQTPYHLAKTCEQFKTNKGLKKCRYCFLPLPLGYTSSQGIRAFDDICEQSQCLIKLKSACSKINSCKHSCYGFKNEKKCIPCLSEKCALINEKQLKGVNQSSYCNICFIQGLGSSPCVKLNCNHIFHLSCLKTRLQVRWFTPRILFNFCVCPLCNAWMQPPQQCQIYKKLMDFKILERLIVDKARQRLKYQNQDKNQKLTDPKSPYYKNQQKYALHLYAYFQCFKCKKPYFGGRKNCAQAMSQQKGQKFDPKELVCPQCCPIQAKNCDKHGKQFINFKCKFCCNVAVWFCWGNTHFCDDCHNKQVAGTYLSKMKKEDLPQCLGPGKCPIGGNHDGNGQTRSLGCGICLNEKAGIKDF